MSDYIKREDAIKAIERISCDTCKRDKCMCKACEYGDSIDEIEDIPSADVVENVRLSPITTATENKPVEYVEVVRCKDCKFWDSDCIWCNLWGNTQEYGNGFCSYGERKDNE